MKLANILTSVRLILIAPVIVCYLIDFPNHQLWAASLFALACLLDWVDGLVARSRKEESRFGAAFDHIADKVLITTTLLVITYQLHSLVITLCSVLIVARELLISGLREYLESVQKPEVMEVNLLGKTKTFVQMATVLFLLASEPFAIPALIGEGFMILVVIITLASAWKYLVQWKGSS